MSNNNYNSAGQGRRLKMWTPVNAGPNSSNTEKDTIVSRSRDAVRNNTWAGAAIDRSVSNGVACGIHAKTTYGTKEFQATVKKLWDLSVGEFDADGVLDFYGLQDLAWREWKEAGEVFVRERPRRESDGLQVPVQYQLIESEQCPIYLNKELANGFKIHQGIEFNKIGKRVGYWFHPVHPGDSNNFSFKDNEPVRVSADQVFHIYRPLRAGQIRGMSDLASTLPKLQNLDNMDDAVLERQHIANLFAGWYTRDASADAPSVIGGSDDEGPLEEAVTSLDDDGSPIAGLEPGSMQELPVGYKVEFSEPPGAGSDYAEFVRGILSAISARMNIPLELLSGDLRGISDRALKLILSDFRRSIERDQWLFFIPNFCQKIRTSWLDTAVLAGKLDIPEYLDKRAEVCNTTWVPQGWPYSHPVQDVDADIKAINAGLSTRTAVNMGNGEDSEEIDRQQAEDNERADELGLKYSSDSRQGKGPAAIVTADPLDDNLNNTDEKINE